ncbi:uncharacterized protein V6R79_011057 [Siganus canaliculatus]
MVKYALLPPAKKPYWQMTDRKFLSAQSLTRILRDERRGTVWPFVAPVCIYEWLWNNAATLRGRFFILGGVKGMMMVMMMMMVVVVVVEGRAVYSPPLGLGTESRTLENGLVGRCACECQRDQELQDAWRSALV